MVPGAEILLLLFVPGVGSTGDDFLFCKHVFSRPAVICRLFADCLRIKENRLLF